MIQADKEGLVYENGKWACAIRMQGDTLEFRVLKPNGILGFTRVEAEEFGKIIAERIVEMEAKKGAKKTKILDPAGMYVCQKCKEPMRKLTVLATWRYETRLEWESHGQVYQVTPVEHVLIKTEIRCSHCLQPVGKEVVAHVVEQYISCRGADG